MNLFVFAGGMVLWVPAVALGIVFGRRAPTLAGAFLSGATAAFLAAFLAPAIVAGILALAVNNRPQLVWVSPPGLVLGLTAFAVPPALTAGIGAAVLRARYLQREQGHAHLTPAVEQAAHARFNPSGKLGDQGAIRPADEGVREDGD